ncbi:polehole-like protein [Penaeus vannamei]|uniref:Polehole-like protein n=1 Tax=Penaeus vannamei TaxID=6689 RepID=A0A423TUS6_PENVA|nr:polehole-like protein [Penaeus vannamei]
MFNCTASTCFFPTGISVILPYFDVDGSSVAVLKFVTQCLHNLMLGLVDCEAPTKQFWVMCGENRRRHQPSIRPKLFQFLSGTCCRPLLAVNQHPSGTLTPGAALKSKHSDSFSPSKQRRYRGWYDPCSFLLGEILIGVRCHPVAQNLPPIQSVRIITEGDKNTKAYEGKRRKAGRNMIKIVAPNMSLFVLHALLMVTASLPAAWSLPGPPNLANLMATMHDRPFRSLADLKAYTDGILDVANLQISKAFSVETRRYKRDLDVTSMKVNRTETMTLSFSSLLQEVSALQVLAAQDKDYWVLGYHSHHDLMVLEVSRNESGVHQLVDSELHIFGGVDKIASHIIGGQLWIAVAPPAANFVGIVRVDLTSPTAAESSQIIPGEGLVGGCSCSRRRASCIWSSGPRTPLAMVHFMPDLGIFLSLSNEGFSDTGFSEWGNYYLVFAMSYSEGSQVYKFDPVVQTVTLLQQLPDTDVYKVLHYIEAQENKHYIVTLNNEGSTKIYWWTSEQLLLWQALDSLPLTRESSSVQAFLFTSFETIIMVSNGGRITIYTDDTSAHYRSDFVIETKCNIIDNMFMVPMEGNHVLIYTCKDDHGNTNLEAQNVAIEEIELEPPVNVPGELLLCLKDLRSELVGSQRALSYIESVTTTGGLMTTDKNQTWTGPVTFSGGLSVRGKTSFQTVTIKGADAVDPNADTFRNFSNKTSEIEDLVETLASNIPDILYHSGNQEITGPVDATSLSSDKFESNVINIDKLNDVPLLNMHHVFMMNGIAQNVSSVLSLHTMNTERFVTRTELPATSINGVYSNQFMLKNATSQEVTGHHAYDHVHATAINSDVSMLINGVDTEHMVMKDANATFTSVKTFQNFTVAKSLDAGLVNGVDLADLSNRTVYTTGQSTQILRGDYTLRAVKVEGNADVKLINNVDLKLLNESVVRTSGDFTLSGKIAYRGDVSVEGNVTNPRVNEIPWKDMIKVSSSDVISGNYYFDDATIATAMNSGNVNGLNFSQDVVLTTGDHIIDGRITFNDSVRVTSGEGVLMAEGATINLVDPSSLRMMEYTEIFMISDAINLTVPLQVTGNVTAHTINNLAMDGIGSRYWRKSTDQVITASPSLKNATFRDTVNGARLNQQQMTNYLNTQGPQTVTGSYVFKAPVSIEGDMQMVDHKTIDDVDISALEEEVIDLTSDQFIEGEVRLTFMEKIEASSMSLSNANLLLESLNGFDLKEAATDIVLANESATISGPLDFAGTVTVGQLHVTGTVDGVDVDDLATRSLKREALQSQLVEGKITVDGAVHLNSAPNLHVVNNKSWADHLGKVVPLNHDGIITGTKIIDQPVFVLGDFNPSTVNGIDLAELVPRILTKSGNQSIIGNYTFSSNITATNIDAPVIDEVNTSDLLLLDQDGFLEGTVVFEENVVMSSVLSGTGLLDGCDVMELEMSASWNKSVGEVDIFSPVNLHKLVVKENAISEIILAGSSKINVQHFLETLVRKSSDQEITGNTTFSADVQINDLWAETLDGVYVDKLYNIAVQDNQDTVISCDLQFTNEVSVANLTVSRTISRLDTDGVLINFLNISALGSRAVLTTSDSLFIDGSKIFVDGFAAGNLDISESLGDVLASDLIVVSKDWEVPSGITFEAPISVSENLKVDGHLDGIDLKQLLEERVTLNGNGTLTSHCIFEEIEVKGNLEVEEINTLTLSDVVVKSGKSQQHITGVKELNGGLFVNGTIDLMQINEMDIMELNRSVVWKDKPATFGKSLVIENVVDSETSVTVQGTVNGLGLHDLDHEVSNIMSNIKSQSEKMTDLSTKFMNVQNDNDRLTCDDNGVTRTYFVTVGRMADVTDLTETTLVTALRLEENQLVKVWSTLTHNSASTVDMTKVNDRWYMLVANAATGNSTSDPYTAKSLVYGWFPSEEKFLVQGEYMGDHVTSAIFLSSSEPVQEHFFALAQLKAADFSSFEDNVKYTTKVLVFRFDVRTSKFKPYESLASYGVVAQEQMRIGDDLYLLLLSEHTRTLDVYEYIFSEGFRLYQQISVCDRPVDLQKMETKNRPLVWISCKNPEAILTLRFNTKGFFYE